MNYRGTIEGISELESIIRRITTIIYHEMGKKCNFYHISETTPAFNFDTT